MTETFNYHQIKEEYGTNVLQQIRTLESLSKKKGRYISHLHFYLQCKHKDLTPKGMKIKAQINGKEARKIIKQAEKALLNVRISEVVRKNKLLDQKKDEAIKTLREKLPVGIQKKIEEINEERQNKELEKSRERQKKKYRSLLEEETRTERTEIQAQAPQETPETVEDTVEENSFRENLDQNLDQNNQDGGNSSGSPVSENLQETEGSSEVIDEAEENEASSEDEDNDVTIPYAEEDEEDGESRSRSKEEDEAVKERWVKNVSSRSLSKSEIALLRKGGGFAVTPKELPHVDFITAIECACKNLAKGE